MVTQMGDAFEHITVAPIPRAPDGDFVTITYCWMFGVSDASEHKEEAWDFLEFVNEPQAGAEISRLGEYFAHQVGAFPSRISDVENQEEFTEEWYSKMADLFQYGRAEPRFVGSEGVKLALYHEIELVLFEGKDPKQALDDAAAEVNRLLAEQ